MSERGSAETALGGHGESALPERSDHRSINRIPVRLIVSQKGRSAPLGRTRDLSLHGMFIETREPFDSGSVLPLTIELEPRLVLSVRAEVVRRTLDGMGLRFRDLDRETSRRLKRWVVEHTSVVGSRRQVEQLIEDSARIEPIRSPERIRGLLDEIRESSATLTLIPSDRVARDQARLVEVGRDSLAMSLEAATSLLPGEDVYALLTLSFVSYSFGLRVLSVDGRMLRCALPDLVVFSERRTRERAPAPAGSFIRWPSPSSPAGHVDLPLIDISDDGLSFRAPGDALLLPGTPLVGAIISVGGRVEQLGVAEIRNLRRVEEQGASYLRVGVALGTARIGRQERSAARVRARTPIGRLMDRFKNAVSVVFHRGRERLGVKEGLPHKVLVRGGALPIVGLLDRTTDDHDERLRAPLVLIVPGFAGRKEQMSFLAGTMIEGFRRQHADLAVLRIDGTNNLGESGKDPECQGDGMHALHYTITGASQDIVAALSWAKNNPLVDPTHIVLVSISMGSIAARHVLARPEGGDVALWISFMGAPDAIDSVRNVSGNIDLHAYWRQSKRLGIVSLGGMLCDGDNFWSDLNKLGAADLDQARADMARIRADVVWLRGRYDAWMDPRRVEAVMRVPAAGDREIIDVESGHLPRTGDEAIGQFVRITQRVWQAVNQDHLAAFSPSIGRLAVRAEAEWRLVRRDALPDRAGWWRRYLLDGEDLGFDVLEYAPEYSQFMDLQATRLLDGLGPHPTVLELGAGTGNLSRRLVEGGAAVHAIDLVPEALARLDEKVAPYAERCRTSVLDLEGSALLAFRRFVAGDLPGPRALMERVPGMQPNLVQELLAHDGDELQAALRGRDVDIASFARHKRLSSSASALLADWNAIARVAQGRATREQVRPRLQNLPSSVLDGPAGLPLPDASVDAVALSLLLSYLDHPDDVLFEAHRVLRPGGRLVASSLMRDAESSQLYLGVVKRIESMSDAELPGAGAPDATRERLLASARKFVDHGAELFRIEEEGIFRFYDQLELEQLLARRGFVSIASERAFGTPGQAVVVTCSKF